MQRIFMVSRYPLFGDAVEELLRERSDLEVVGRESDSNRAAQKIRELCPDVVTPDDADPASNLSSLMVRILAGPLGVKAVGLNLGDNAICTAAANEGGAEQRQRLMESVQSPDRGRWSAALKGRTPKTAPASFALQRSVRRGGSTLGCSIASTGAGRVG